MFTINREKYSGKIPPSRYELDGKYKLILDLSGKLDSQYRQVKNLKQLFSSNLNELRRQISEEISSIFRYAPIEYGRICEEILWKKTYYECVKFFKIFRRSSSHSTTTTTDLDSQLVLFRSHLISGIGHYNGLILSFRKLFHLANLDDLIFLPIVNEKFPNFTLNNPFNNILGDETATSVNEQQQSQNDEQTIKRFDLDEDSDDEAQIDFELDYTHDEKFKETLLFLVNRFFICIGDLARYYSDLFGNDENRFEDHYFKMASFYYKSASLVQPHLGMPYNQLGTLYIHSPHGLDTLYYYFRCLNSKKPFVGIKENLRQTFERVRRQSSHIGGSRHLKSDLNNTRKNNQNYTNGFVTIKECDFQTDSDLVRTTLFRMIDVVALLFKLIDELAAENGSQPIPVEKLLIDLYETMVLFRNALNIESSGETNSNKLNKSNQMITIEQIFRMISIVMVLIDQIKMIFTKNSIEIDLGQVNDVLINSKLEKGAELETRGNFLLYISYQFLFQMITMVVHRECETLKKILYASNNLMDDNPRMMANNNKKSAAEKKTIKIKSMKKDAAPKMGQYSQSFSSDYGDQLDEAMSQLKNTAFQTIQDILDSSENEDEDLITFDNENDRCEIKLINHLNDEDYPNEDGLNSNYNDSKTFDQILAFIYTNSSITIIKFFCDYLQSNSDFMEILKNMPVLFEYFDHFFQYLNILSEFDFKSLANFKSYLEQQFLHGNVEKDKLNRLMDLFNFINQCSHYSVKDFKQIWPLSSEMEYMNLTEELSNFYQQMFKCPNDISLMNLKNELSVEKSSYLSIRCLLIFGIKLSLLSLEKDKFKLMAQNLDLATVHNVKQNKHVSFVYELLQPLDSSSILKNDRYLIVKKINPDQQLISFDSNDKEVENACNNQQQSPSNSTNFNQTNHTNNEENKVNTPNLTPTQGSSKSWLDLAKLPYIMIDPYVYLESIDQIKQIVQNKKAFLIVPKLVSDFLNNLKAKGIPAAIEAADFLQDEFLRGSRIIRFIRNEDRLELEMLNYPKTYKFRRTVDGADDWQYLDNMANKSKSPEQDLALFYELLEHCHYLLVNRVLVNRRLPTIGDGFRGGGNPNNPKSNVQITLITNNLSKWPANSATTIAQTCGIEIETLDSYLAKQQNSNNKNNKTKNNVNKFRRNHQRQTRSPQSHFRPIQFVATPEMSAHRPVT